MNDTLTGNGPGRILVVDDTSANLKLLSTLLTEQGYTVYPASDGELALEFVRSTLPDLVLLDIRMPGLDGYEVCRRLKSDDRTSEVPVIFISALENERDKIQGFRAGGVDYITKPFQSEEVLARIRLHLQFRALTVRLEQEVTQRTGELAATNRRLEEELVERRRTEETLAHLNRELRAISDCNQVLVRAEEEQALLEEICRIVCEKAGYRIAWVGYPLDGPEKTVRPAAWAGVGTSYLENITVTWSDTPQGQGPTGLAVRTGNAACIQDFATDPKAAPWREVAHARGYRSCISLPLKDSDKKVFGVFNIYSSEPNTFTTEEVRLLGELASDLAFGIGVLRARRTRAKAEEEAALRGFALNSVHEAAYLIDQEGRFLYVNDEACRMLKYDRKELLHASISDFDPDFPAERWPEHWRDIKERRSLTFEGRHRTRAGIFLPVEINANYFEYQGRPYNLALVRDISERRQVELERQEHLRYFEAMDRTNRAIQAAGDLDEMMRQVLDETLEVFGCDRAYLLFPCTPDSPTWTVPMERNKPEYPGVLELGLEMPMTEEVAATTRALLASDRPLSFGPGGDFSLPEDVAARFGFHSFMATALYPKTGKPWQFGIHQCSGPRLWTTHERRIFGEIARRLGDGLTGLLAYRELQESESRYRRIVDTAAEGICELDVDGRLTSVNARLAEIMGYQPEEMIGRLITEGISEEDLAEHRRIMERRRRGETMIYERRFLRKDGQTIWAMVSATPVLDEHGSFQGSFAMITDITARIKAEDYLRQLNEELEERVRERTLELARSHDNLQKSYDDLKTAQSRILQQEKMASIGQLAAGVAHEINNPMGFVLSNLNTLGKYTGRLIEFQNAQQLALDELAGQSKPAQTKNEELKALAKSLKIKAVNADIDDLLAESIEGGERVKKIVLNLKNFARLDEAELKEADLNQCLDSTLNIVWNELKYKCTVNKDYDDIPLIKCNPGQLNQVFMNLLVNAGQAIENQGEIRISTRHDNGFVEVHIEDTGSGIPPDKLSRIFEPFFTTKVVGKGTGLGLSIAHDIVKSHGGEISAESKVGKGTEFIIRLPFKPEINQKK